MTNLLKEVKKPLKKCQNPSCDRLVDPVKRRSNRRGMGMYCSRGCYHVWSPGMQEAFERLVPSRNWSNFGVETSPPDLFLKQLLVHIITRFNTWTARAAIVGVSRQTFNKWVRHFELEVMESTRRVERSSVQ